VAFHPSSRVAGVLLAVPVMLSKASRGPSVSTSAALRCLLCVCIKCDKGTLPYSSPARVSERLMEVNKTKCTPLLMG
jgi:hypothetical protein